MRGKASAVARRGEIFPGFTLPAIDGSSVFLESYRGRSNLVFVFAGDKMEKSPVTVLLEELEARAEELTLEAAQVLVAVTSRPAAFADGVGGRLPGWLETGAPSSGTGDATTARG